MPVTDKVKAAMAVSGKENKDLAQYLGITKQALSNKFNRGSYSVEDLVKNGMKVQKKRKISRS